MFRIALPELPQQLQRETSLLLLLTQSRSPWFLCGWWSEDSCSITASRRLYSLSRLLHFTQLHRNSCPLRHAAGWGQPQTPDGLSIYGTHLHDSSASSSRWRIVGRHCVPRDSRFPRQEDSGELWMNPRTCHGRKRWHVQCIVWHQFEQRPGPKHDHSVK